MPIYLRNFLLGWMKEQKVFSVMSVYASDYNKSIHEKKKFYDDMQESPDALSKEELIIRKL